MQILTEETRRVVSENEDVLGDKNKLQRLTSRFSVLNIEEKRSKHLLDVHARFSKSCLSRDEFVIHMYEHENASLSEALMRTLNEVLRFNITVNQPQDTNPETAGSDIVDMFEEYMNPRLSRSDNILLSIAVQKALDETTFMMNDCRNSVILTLPRILDKFLSMSYNEFLETELKFVRKTPVTRSYYLGYLLNERPRKARRMIREAVDETCKCVHISKHGVTRQNGLLKWPKRIIALSIVSSVLLATKEEISSLLGAEIGEHLTRSFVAFLDWLRGRF